MRVQILLDGEPLFDSGDKDPPSTLYRTLAALWCGMTDDDQAKFFEEVGRQVKDATWWDMQAYRIAAHMRTCECVSTLGRDALHRIVDALSYQKATP